MLVLPNFIQASDRHQTTVVRRDSLRIACRATRPSRWAIWSTAPSTTSSSPRTGWPNSTASTRWGGGAPGRSG